MTGKKPRRVTSKQVAERAGVSQTTVSFVLNNVEDANISAETKERVFQAARELKYIPDATAQSLARGRSNNIAFVLAQPHPQVFIDEYLPKLLTGITNVARQSGFRIMVEMAENDQLDQVYANLLGGTEVAGVIVNFNGTSETIISQISAAAESNFPIVSTVHLHHTIHSVEVDKLSGVRTMMRHLMSLGHRRIGVISYAPPGTNRHADYRIRVVRKMLKDVGSLLDDDLVGYGSYDPETGYQVMCEMLRVQPLPTAIFALNDIMAFGAIRAINEAGLRVPDDIAVVGFDDVRLAAFTTPPLTTMYEPDVDHGRLSAELLMALIRGETPPQKHITLETQLIVRESCGASRLQK
jgi:DNA-binding LacI/PurR family transcriptional regulator